MRTACTAWQWLATPTACASVAFQLGSTRCSRAHEPGAANVSDHENSNDEAQDDAAQDGEARNDEARNDEAQDGEAQDGETQVTSEAAERADALSPSVRRLVKQYDLDITRLRGTGPGGRIRVGDVMGLIGGREGGAGETSAPRVTEGREPSPGTLATRDAGPASRPAEAVAAPGPEDEAEPARGTEDAAVTTTVFECDAGRILEDQRRHREQGREIALSAYFVAAFAKALSDTRVLAARGTHAIPALAVDSAHGAEGAHVLTNADGLSVEQIAVALHAPAVAPPTPVALVRHHGAGGSLLVQPERLAPGHAAVLGIGRIRRQVVVRVISGEETPRIASQCLLSLSFRSDEVTLEAANRLLGRCVEHVERWHVLAS